jgi:hypothetical protein
MNENELPGPSITVFVFEGGIPYEGESVWVGVGVVVPPFSDADALLPHAAATSASATMPIRSPSCPEFGDGGGATESEHPPAGIPVGRGWLP